MALYLSVDLGGTNLRMGVLDAQGKILALRQLSADRVRDPGELVQVLAEESLKLAKENNSSESKIRGLALGIPGLVDGSQGIVLQSPHFPLWREISVREELEKLLPWPIVMDNDANQAALGEAWKGAGRDWKDFVLLTLGTGIGGGIILDGKIFHGPTGFAGELGHIVIERHGLPGALGSGGTLESLASSSGLQVQVASMQKKKSGVASEILQLRTDSAALPEELCKLAHKGNIAAQEIWEDFGNALGCGIASAAHTLGVFNFVIGGGLTAAWEFFGQFCQEVAKKRSYSSLQDRLQVVRARLGNEAGLVGGVRQIQQQPQV
jgi:Transcriptional regulator/sugar kinase